MYTHDKTSMFLRIHISKAYLQSYLPDVELYRINCFPEEITDEQFPEYYRICKLLAELTRLYIMDTPFFRLEAEGIILQIVAQLIRHFSSSAVIQLADTHLLTIDRIRKVMSYASCNIFSHIAITSPGDGCEVVIFFPLVRL